VGGGGGAGGGGGGGGFFLGGVVCGGVVFGVGGRSLPRTMLSKPYTRSSASPRNPNESPTRRLVKTAARAETPGKVDGKEKDQVQTLSN